MRKGIKGALYSDTQESALFQNEKHALEYMHPPSYRHMFAK